VHDRALDPGVFGAHQSIHAAATTTTRHVQPFAPSRPQASLPAAVRAAFIGARLEWHEGLTYGVPLDPYYMHNFHWLAVATACKAVRPHLPARLAWPAAHLIAALACPPPLRWPRLVRNPYRDDG
jgi:hypothetical protein